MSTHTVRARGTTKRSRVVIGVITLVVVLLAGLALRNSIGGGGRVSVTAVFSDSSPLVPGNKVQLHGVSVGTVSSIDLVAGKANVVLSLDRLVLPLHIDATARIEPVSLLGERFVALGQGSPSAPEMTSPMVIPESRTGSSVDLADLINTLNDPTSTALAAMVTTLGEGTAGQGGNVAQALQALPPTLRQADRLSMLLDQQNVVLNNLVVSAQKNATAFAEPLDSLVGSAQQTLGVVAANRGALDGTLTRLPGTLTAAQRTLNQLGSTADNTADALSGIRPLTDHLDDASRELRNFADAANPALDSLPDVLTKADRMLDEARPLVRDLRPAASGLRGVSDSVGTLTTSLVAHPPGVPSSLENVMEFLGNWAMACNGYDGLSHYFRFGALLTPSDLLTTVKSAGPPIANRNPVPKNPYGPDLQGPAPLLPTLPTLPNPDGPDNGISTTPRDAPRTAPRGAGRSRSDGVLGLSPKQESDMFDQLLGGGN